MTEENKRRNIAQEVSKAETVWTEASLLHENGLYSGAVSRAYYHAFHFALALLLTEGLEAKTHGVLAHLVNLHFVRTELLEPRVARYLGELEGERSAADYDSAVVYTEEMASEKLSKTRAFGEAARRIIERAGYL